MIGLVVGVAMGLGACAQIIGLEPWQPGEGSSSAMTGAGGTSSASSSNASGAGGHGGALATSSSSSSPATSSSSSTTSSSSGGGIGLCDACQNNKQCMSGCCKMNLCVNNVNLCMPGVTCPDGCTNGTETAVDCGGMLCPPCTTGQPCKVNADCESGICQANGGSFFCT